MKKSNNTSGWENLGTFETRAGTEVKKKKKNKKKKKIEEEKKNSTWTGLGTWLGTRTWPPGHLATWP